jgi:O-antigen ligase
MVCPAFLIAGQNLSLFVFIALVFFTQTGFSFFQFKHPVQLNLLAFGIGALISTIGVSDDNEAVIRALVVLPNYIYWCVLVWVFVSIAVYIPYQKIMRFMFIALCVYIVYYLFFRNFSIKGWTAQPSQNSFSLVLLCFTAPTMVYLKTRYGLKQSIAALVFILLLLITDGRRAGTMLTLVSSLGALVLPNIQVRYLTTGIIITLASFVFLTTDFGESLIETLNPRIHNLIYEADKITTQDRSYLTRKLMIEKGLILFEENPISGIGLNSFKSVDVDFLGEFEGSEFVLNKEDTNETSSHNSYINILAEGGLMLFIPFLALIAFNLYHFVRDYNHRNIYTNSYYWAFFAMSIHLYFITGIVNVFVWFLIALVTALSSLNIQPRR